MLKKLFAAVTLCAFTTHSIQASSHQQVLSKDEILLDFQRLSQESQQESQNPLKIKTIIPANHKSSQLTALRNIALLSFSASGEHMGERASAFGHSFQDVFEMHQNQFKKLQETSQLATNNHDIRVFFTHAALTGVAMAAENNYKTFDDNNKKDFLTRCQTQIGLKDNASNTLKIHYSALSAVAYLAHQSACTLSQTQSTFLTELKKHAQQYAKTELDHPENWGLSQGMLSDVFHIFSNPHSAWNSPYYLKNIDHTLLKTFKTYFDDKKRQTQSDLKIQEISTIVDRLSQQANQHTTEITTLSRQLTDKSNENTQLRTQLQQQPRQSPMPEQQPLQQAPQPLNYNTFPEHRVEISQESSSSAQSSFWSPNATKIASATLGVSVIAALAL